MNSISYISFDSYTWFIIGFFVFFVLILVSVILGAIFGKGKRLSKQDQQDIERAGLIGEIRVSNILLKLLTEHDGYHFDDFCFEDRNGFSSEIDHILITKGGVFIIETKANKGRIYGSTLDKLWYCRKKDYQDDKTFKNPIIQNQGHINHLRKMLGRNAPIMKSVVIFPDADISNVFDDNVFDLRDAAVYLKEQTVNGSLTPNEMINIYKQFQVIQSQFGITKEKHIENIKRLHQ